MGTLLDIRTLTFVAGIVFLILFITVMYVYFSRTTYPGFLQFIIAAFMGFVGFILLSLRGMIPDFLGTVCANTFLIIFMIFISFGIDLYAGKERNRWIYAGPVLVAFAVHTGLMMLTETVTPRTIANSLVGIAVCLYTIRRLFRDAPTLGGTNWFMILSLIILGLWFGGRSVYAVFFAGTVVDVMSSPSQRIALLVYIVCAINMIIGIILVNAQRVEHDLSRSNAEVKMLRGILPICASCKKIRDDTGYWNQIEAYIRDHSEAEFSHGICPDCAKKLYPNLGT